MTEIAKDPYACALCIKHAVDNLTKAMQVIRDDHSTIAMQYTQAKITEAVEECNRASEYLEDEE